MLVLKCCETFAMENVFVNELKPNSLIVILVVLLYLFLNSFDLPLDRESVRRRQFMAINKPINNVTKQTANLLLRKAREDNETSTRRCHGRDVLGEKSRGKLLQQFSSCDMVNLFKNLCR